MRSYIASLLTSRDAEHSLDRHVLALLAVVLTLIGLFKA